MSLNKYNSSTGVLENIASGQRAVIYTKAAYEAAKQAGTLPADTLVMITDDVKENSMPKLDLAHKVDIGGANTNYTTTADGCIAGDIYKLQLSLDGDIMSVGDSSTACPFVLQYVPSGTVITTSSQAVPSPRKLWFIPYKTED